MHWQSADMYCCNMLRPFWATIREKPNTVENCRVSCLPGDGPEMPKHVDHNTYANWPQLHCAALTGIGDILVTFGRTCSTMPAPPALRTNATWYPKLGHDCTPPHTHTSTPTIRQDVVWATEELTSQLTNSMRYSPSQADSSSASQAIPSVLCNPRSYRVRNSPISVPVLGQINPIHILPSYFLKTHFNITLPSLRRSSQRYFSFR